MPVQVISLLSSSDAGSPPPQVARTPSPRRESSPKATSLDLDDDFFVPTRSPPRQHGTAALSRSKPVSSGADDVWVISDDEELGPAVNAPQSGDPSADGTAPKRRRLDTDLDSMPSAAIVAALSSSQEPIHTAPPRPSDEQQQPRINWLEHDPFASSSPRVPEAGQSGSGCMPTAGLNDDHHASFSPRHGRAQPATISKRQAGIDDIDPFASSSPGPERQPPKSAQTAAAPWDPISSSAPLPAAVDDGPSNPPRSLRRTQSEIIIMNDSEEDCAVQASSDDDFPDISDLAPSTRGSAALPGLSAVSGMSKPSREQKSAGTKASVADPKKKSMEKMREREQKAAAREAEKERKRLEKERAKEEKAQEKARAAALAEVNKIRTDKKVSTPEMIVDLPATLDQAVKLQAETLLRDLDVHSTSWSSPVENVVKWRRRVRSRYNDDLGLWEPIPERIERESYAMVLVPAAQFVDLVLGEDASSLESHVLRMKRHFPKDTIIYLIEGLTVWLRKNRNARNRHFVSAVRSGLEPADEPPNLASSSQAAATNANPRRRKNNNAAAPTYIDEDAVEEALLQLQVEHGVLIHHTSAPVETARWIAVFTQHISTVPYRRQRDAANDAAFCMETGQVRTGDGPRDTYVRVLQEIARVTAPIAYGIAAEFGSLPELVRGLQAGGPLALERVRRSVNKEGEVGERTVGQAVSRRLYKIFMGRDESSTDI